MPDSLLPLPARADSTAGPLTVILGGGITGLSLAYFLQQSGARYQVIEASHRWGGKIRTRQRSGFTLEEGPDSCMTQTPAAAALFRELGLDRQWMATAAESKQVYIWDRQRLRPLPEGWMQMRGVRLRPFLATDLISWPGKLRMALEYFLPPQRTRGDESLAAFVRRRLGGEALDKFVAPLLANIFAADPEQLSLASAFPRFRDMERQYGGLIRAMRAQQPGAGSKKALAVQHASAQHAAAGPQSASARPASAAGPLSLQGGMETLIQSLLARLHPDALCTGLSAVGLEGFGHRWRLHFADRPPIVADRIVFAMPAYAVAELLRSLDISLADELLDIPYASTASVSLAFLERDLPGPLHGSGFVVARGEPSLLRACTWTSSKYPASAPAGTVLLRVFLGGATHPTLAELPPAELEAIARQELARTLGIEHRPLLTHVTRWLRGQPQFPVGHKETVARLEQALQRFPGLHLAGAAFHGSGIPNCIASAQRVAEQILSTPAEVIPFPSRLANA